MVACHAVIQPFKPQSSLNYSFIVIIIIISGRWKNMCTGLGTLAWKKKKLQVMVYFRNIWEAYSKTLKNVTKKRQSLKYALMVNDFWETSMSNSCRTFIILIFIIQSARFSIWNKDTQRARRYFRVGKWSLPFAFWSMRYFLFKKPPSTNRNLQIKT